MRMKRMAALLAGTLAIVPAVAASAQDGAIPQRVDRLEKEMRAVQRKVFPGGSQQYLEPEIAPQTAPAGPVGTPASSPVADLSARVNSLEQELARITGQVETNSFKLRQLEESFARSKADADARASGAAGAGPVSTAPAPPAVLMAGPSPRPSASPPPRAAPADAAAAPPASGDPAEDAYLAGYRLWEQKQYPEAEAALRAVVAKYPSSRRASYAQNLLGRALLEDGQPAKAAKEFYSNYQTMPRGERAPDSLYFLGQSLMALRPPKPADACKVYGELLDVYGPTIAQTLKDKVAKGQADAKCAK